jgi:hypothetical protein
VPPGGVYKTERLATGVNRGSFSITATVVPPATARSTFEQRQPAPNQARTSQDAQAATDQAARARQVINDSVLQVGGKLFPKIMQLADFANSTGTNAPPQSCCKLGETRKSDVASIDITSPKNMPKNKEYPSDGPIQAVYSPPLSCWVISGYSRVVTSANTPYYAFDDAQPGDFKYTTSAEYQSVLEQMKNYVATFNILDKYKGDLNAKLEEFVKNYGQYANSIGTSHGQVRHTARLKGRGFPNGRSWYKGYIHVTEICCPPEIRDAAQLRATLKSWIDETVNKLPCLGRD